MRLTNDDLIWAPVDQPVYLLAYRQGRRFPKDRDDYLNAKVDMLARIVAESNDGEIDNANNILKDGLVFEFGSFLPVGLLHNPETPHRLFFNPKEEGSHFHEWVCGIEEALASPPMREDDARQEAENLSLESFLTRIVL
jgi:hypothetical protein